ncbi:protein of unknown function UPF0187 [Gloeothece citriformis PCC 7424]|uniref:Uncharacterized protein n=1 Tax=Gloeothece citriformis (strain PCC 7424) TaxID=65393 RepID=B7K901_GLOC7|nr:bestrophin family ion channel [Gloeothece citriformis]ACK72770.1 protein of unknown function UPF0187 [Gloeothece citriformis PCC 7424]
MISSNFCSWFQDLIKIKNKKFWIKTLPPVLIFASIGGISSVLVFWDVPIPFQAIGDITANVACNLVLGLLLVFRTNTAYDRFWQGRAAWGTITVSIRNLVREIQIGIIEDLEEKQQEKITVLKLLGSFVIATKLHLRQTKLTDELDRWIDPHYIISLKQATIPPLEITFWLSAYIQQAYQRQKIDSHQQVMMINLINELVAGLSSCDRIRTTPAPLSYRKFLKKLLFVYCSLLSFSLVDIIHGWTGLSVAIISLFLLGVEEIANQIENPFGHDESDLPLDEICQTILDNVESAIAFGNNFREQNTGQREQETENGEQEIQLSRVH